MVAEYRASYGRVTSEQRFTVDDPCPGCGGYDSRRLGHARCWGVRTSNGRGFICTVASSSHPAQNGDGWVHLYTGCDCGADHSEAYHLQPLRRRAPDAPVKITQAHKVATPSAIYAYGETLRFLRFTHADGTKHFTWQHFDRDHGWIDGRAGLQPGLYRADSLASADTRKPVYITEGEKCVDALRATGAVATCNPDGASCWRAEYNAAFTGRSVVILADADETGRKHAQAIADSLASVASSVRLLELEGAHDVADWLADGHTLQELLEIIVCLPSAQNSNPGMSSSTGGADDTKNAICPNCKRERAERQIAETSLANLRREQAMTARILALPKEQLSPPLKPAAIAVREVLSQPKARDAQGMELVYRRAISQRCGVSDETAGAYLRKLAEAGVIHREVRKSFDSTEIHISEGPLFDAPEQIAPTPITWGGKRTKKGCPHCKSIDIVPTVYGCTNCGAHLRAEELIDIEVQDDAQDTPPPPDTIVPDLAPDGEVFACPECGRQGDMLHDYGDGWLRCRACDVPAERQVS